MKKFLKIAVWSVLTLVVLLSLSFALFIYKVYNGFPVSYETEAPEISFPDGKKVVLLFSKSTGFRHGESIETGKKTFAQLAEKNSWFLFETESGGVFNPYQLARFDVVIFNNSTGRVLNDEQQANLEAYVEQGGRLIGIHGAGDNSHHWDWYVNNLLSSEFSHHSLNPQLQEAEVRLNSVPDSIMIESLPATWTHTDEWYVFFENPRAKGFNVVYALDGDKINPSGNLLWMTNKGFGMFKDHPVAWYKSVGAGEAFYTSMGHGANSWNQEAFVRILENAVNH